MLRSMQRVSRMIFALSYPSLGLKQLVKTLATWDQWRRR